MYFCFDIILYLRNPPTVKESCRNFLKLQRSSLHDNHCRLELVVCMTTTPKKRKRDCLVASQNSMRNNKGKGKSKQKGPRVVANEDLPSLLQLVEAVKTANHRVSPNADSKCASPLPLFNDEFVSPLVLAELRFKVRMMNVTTCCH